MLTSLEGVILGLCLSVVCSITCQFCRHRVAEVIIWTSVSYQVFKPYHGSRTGVECPNKAVILQIVANARQVESYRDVKGVQH